MPKEILAITKSIGEIYGKGKRNVKIKNSTKNQYFFAKIIKATKFSWCCTVLCANVSKHSAGFEMCCKVLLHV